MARKLKALEQLLEKNTQLASILNNVINVFPWEPTLHGKKVVNNRNVISGCRKRKGMKSRCYLRSR